MCLAKLTVVMLELGLISLAGGVHGEERDARYEQRHEDDGEEEHGSHGAWAG